METRMGPVPHLQACIIFWWCSPKRRVPMDSPRFVINAPYGKDRNSAVLAWNIFYSTIDLNSAVAS